MPESPLGLDQEGQLTVSLNLNGTEQRIRVKPQATLLDVLTRTLLMTGTREGCGIGVCGACTVLVDDQPLSACLLFAFQLEGSSVVTVEGLSTEAGGLDRVQQAFAEATAFQCSYCTPGFILTAHALLKEHPDVDASAARDYLSGNLCRCGSYVKILRSVLSLARPDE